MLKLRVFSYSASQILFLTHLLEAITIFVDSLLEKSASLPVNQAYFHKEIQSISEVQHPWFYTIYS